MHPLDPYRAATLIIREYGADAVRYCEERAEILRGLGDAEGVRVWGEVKRAVGVLQQMEPEEGERWQ